MNTYLSVVSSGMSATGVFSRKCRRKLQIIEGVFKWDNKNREN